MENEAGGRLPTLMNDDDDAMEESKIEQPPDEDRSIII